MQDLSRLVEDINKYSTFFCKVLTKNDDSGRHGVLIPVQAYSMFPNFPTFDPVAKQNYDQSITTIWDETNGINTRDSYWRHYHRYPERRMTSLSPELLNEKDDSTILLIGKYKDAYTYRCFVISPSNQFYNVVGEAFKLNKEHDLYMGSALVSAEVLLPNHATNPALDELIEHIRQINTRGYVRTLRAGDTGVGFTFETLMNITANSSKEPDFKGIEIKTSRSKQIKEKRKVSTGKQTLFTLIPNWGLLGNRRELVVQYGKDDDVRARRGLYCTIKVVPNSYDFHLEINESEQKISIMQKDVEVVHYELARIREALENKHKESMFITAHSQKNALGEEEFLYDSAVYCNNVSFEGFLELVKENIIGLDFAIHTKDGKTRDHGFLWRLDNKKYLFRLFETVQEVV